MTIVRLNRDNVYSYHLIDCYKKKLAEKKAIIEKHEAVIKRQEAQMQELTQNIENQKANQHFLSGWQKDFSDIQQNHLEKHFIWLRVLLRKQQDASKVAQTI